MVVGSQTPWLEVVLLARSNLIHLQNASLATRGTQRPCKSEEGTSNFDNDHLLGNQKKLSP